MNIYYGKIDYNLSDHKPVTGLFEAKIKVVNAAMKQKVIDKLIQKYHLLETESESSRKQTFLKHIEASKDEGTFQINHFAGRSKSMANISVLSKPPIDDVEQLDVDEDNFLKLENYDLSNINEIQRKLVSQADYENLNQKLGDLDDSMLEKQLKIDSVKKDNMIITEENQENGWSDVQAEELKQDGEYMKSLTVNP